MLINHPHPLYSLQSRLSTAYEVIFAYTEVFHFFVFHERLSLLQAL